MEAFGKKYFKRLLVSELNVEFTNSVHSADSAAHNYGPRELGRTGICFTAALFPEYESCFRASTKCPRCRCAAFDFSHARLEVFIIGGSL